MAPECMLAFGAMAHRTLLPGFLLFFLLVGCPAPETAAPWHRHDLWRAPEAVEAKPAAIGQQRAWHRRLAHLGSAEIRDRSRVQSFHFEVVPSLPASEVRALEQVADSRLRYALQLGEEPFFSFIPLRNDQNPWPCRYRVSVRLPGQQETEREVYSEVAPYAVPPGQETVTIDLAAFAGRSIQLLLEVDAPSTPTAAASPPPQQGVPRVFWGSPAVYSRGPLEPKFQSPEAATPERPNVLLIGADTLRADALGAYGATPSVTPALDHLATESDVWLEAYSSFNVTNPSFASLMTGLYGKNHDVYNLSTPLPEFHETLAERFSTAGYRTLAVLAARHLNNQRAGLDQGFDRVVLPERTLTAEAGVDISLDWISESPQPFFLWLHLFDAHTPHTPPAPFALGYAADRRWGVGPVGGWWAFRPPGPVEFVDPKLGGALPLYVGEVAYLDRQIDRLMDFLESRGLLRNTIVAFVADHGENLEEHGALYAHHGLFESTLHVPLLIRWPGDSPTAGRRIPGLVQHLDLYPTLLAAAGLEVPEQDGEDLRELTREGRSGRRAVFSEHAHQKGVRLRVPGWAYYRSHGNKWVADGDYLYDLRQDPHEDRNLAGTGLPIEADLRSLMDRWLADRRQTGKAVPSNLTPEEIERLRSLGYLE